MAITDAPIIRLQISTIVIPEYRQREKTEADADLISSIEQRGLINPIIVRDGNVLVAGGRRLDAHKKLNRMEIEARNLEDLPEEDALIIEFAENYQRQNLSWQDEAAAVARYHELMVNKNVGWTQLATANNLSMSEASVSRRLLVSEGLDDDAVRGCQSINAAINFMQSRAQRAISAAKAAGHQFADAMGVAFDPLAKPDKADLTAALIGEVSGKAPAVAEASEHSLIAAGKLAADVLKKKREEAPADKQPAGSIICTDFIKWAESYSDVPFDVVHCDFPYGKDYKGANTSKQAESTNPIYDDSADVLRKLLTAMLEHQDNFIAESAHCIFWHDVRHADWIIAKFLEAGWKHHSPYPLIWTKGNSGSPGDYKSSFRHCYEVAHLFSRGGRPIVKQVQDHFPHPVDEDKLHLSQKPVPMLRHFLSGLVDENSRVLDPTCGSGSAIAAANLLHADYTLGIELDQSNAEIARFMVQRVVSEAP